MVARAGEDYVLLGKKLYGLYLIILGFVLMAVGIYSTSTGLVVLGGLSLVVGLILLALKIARRNERSQIR